MKVISVNIGERKTIKWKNKTVETGIFKYPVDTPIFLDVEDVKNDSVIDRKNHGGFNKAVYAYGKQHYKHWQELYPDLDWNFGMLGENLTITNLEETQLYIGSVYQLGEAIIEVSQPRSPCYKLGIRFNDPKIIKQFWNSTKSGVYFKVLETGLVSVNDELVLLKKVTNNSTIADAHQAKKILKGQ
ncbi:MAG TPA: MOSC domain-containing protein [Flavobacteriaceae bacterium]|jgi:MOSC domain-containing protein YiiM|nr:MOSC domain-containing protein [Flavobacteriaceae bacterium]HBS12802.1 MOSC domain-containing protein [Flavobacteriaceae bacterium]